MSKVHTNPPQTEGLLSLESLRSGLIAAGRTLQAMLHAMQTARMIQALCRLSDDQLAQIGIERSDIPNYADRLMSGGRADDEQRSHGE